MGTPATNAFLDKIDISNLGMNSGADPTILPDNQHSFACNTTFRGGHPCSRPPIRKIRLSYADGVESGATEALFQEAAYYESIAGRPGALLMSASGRIFRFLINNNSAMVDELTGADINNPTRDQAWMFQGEEFMVINDGESQPFIFDGAGLRRAISGEELPPSRMGHYVNGRFVVALPDGRSFIAGDLVTSPSGTPAYGYRDAILKTTENQTILQGKAFAVPLTAGPITSLFSVAIPDTSLGQGPLQVGTRKGVFSVDLPLDATQWTTTLQPSSTVSLPSYGPTGQSAVAIVNGDAWYRAKDGIRSFVVARRDFNTWVQTALSFEMNSILPSDTKSLLKYASSVVFDNRLLMTCSPHRVRDRGVAHRGLVALDFNNISSLTMRSQPSYDGLWTGLEVLKIVIGEFDEVERCFMFALDADNKICLYELLETETDQNFDNNGSEDVQIESWLVSNALFGRESQAPQITLPLKKLLLSDFFLEELAGDVEVDLKFRSDQWPFWVDWNAFEFCAPSTNCPENCEPFEPVHRQYATFHRTPEPPEECNSLTGRQHRTGYYFQIRLQWTGRLKLHQLLVWSQPILETVPTQCPSPTCQVVKGCGDNFFTYEIEG